MLLLFNALFVFKPLDEYQSVLVIYCSWVSQVVPDIQSIKAYDEILNKSAL